MVSVIGGETYTLRYDAENRVVKVDKGNATLMKFVYDGDGKQVKSEKYQNGVVTETILFVGAHYQIINGTVTKYYFAGASRIAMRKYTIPSSMALEYFLSDHLGSTSLTTDTAGVKVSEMRYKPWGEVRYSWKNAPANTSPVYALSKYTFTGQYSYMDDPSTSGVTEGFGLMFYNARWYDPALGRFAQADTIVPGERNSQAWDRYAYTLNNPVRYNDPSGHEPHGPGSCYYVGDPECDKTRQDLLFSRVFKGSAPDGSWTQSDWEYYYENRSHLYLHPESWINNDDVEEGWDLFALHVERLASHYTIDQKDQFVRDFALLFGGVPTASSNDFVAMLKARGGPPIPLNNFDDKSYLHYENTGLSSDYLDKYYQDNQSHHYAGIFYLAYWASPDVGAMINFGRDPRNPGDIYLGGQAAIDAYFFWTTATDLSALSKDISRLSSLR